MKLLAVCFMSAVALYAAGSLRVFGYEWSIPEPGDWKVDGENGSPVLHLLVGKEPPANGPRRPFQFAVADTPAFNRVKVEADVKPLGSSLMIVFAYRDAAHFDYAHLSVDTAAKQTHHNGIFHVYGGERVRISAENGPGAFDANNRWHHVVLDWDGNTGLVQVRVDGSEVPALRAVDLSLKSGKVGIGSFDETGEFKNVKITGHQAGMQTARNPV
jgi:hypothetical protein